MGKSENSGIFRNYWFKHILFSITFTYTKSNIIQIIKDKNESLELIWFFSSSETIAASDLKVSRSSHLIEYMKIY